MRKILIVLLILAAGQFALAQPGGRFGVKGGTNLYFLKASNNRQLDYRNPRAGFVVGVSYELALNKMISIQPELNYSTQNAREDYFGSKLNVSYTQIPVLFQFHPTVRNKLYAGPQVSFLGTAKTTAQDGTKTGISNQLNQTDFGVAFGVAHLPAQSGISVDVRVYQGMMNVYKAEYDNGLKTRNLLVSLTVGYLFKR
ncbi:MAG: PorT family protein [Chitinophagaceae bacterium]|nr:PorT family protein [Chitinophagaceae bacterium]